nr:hypothetical protein [Candidatus Njordarchaeum guaymaensis]
MYISNLFKSTRETDFTRFRCYKNKLVVTEPEAWRILRENGVDTPYYVAQKSIYYTDKGLADLQFFRMLTRDLDPRRATISNKTVVGARAVGSMLYRALVPYLTRLGFKHLGGITAGSVYFVPDDPMYLKEIQGRQGEGFYQVFRGFGPKVHAKSIVGTVTMILETRSKFKVTVPFDAWPRWVGYAVKATEGVPAMKGLASLESISPTDRKVTLRQRKVKFQVSIDSVSVPASPATLGKRGVYEDLLEFAQFRDEADQTIKSAFEFLAKVYDMILKDNSIMISLDSRNEHIVTFRRVDFRV